MRWLGILTVLALTHTAPAAAAPAKRKPAAPKKGPAAASAPKTPPAPKVVAPEHPQFLRDIAPILDKQGCSIAACHGKFGGRGDFQVSLLTLAPEDDYNPIVYGARGRRVNLQEPEQSLILLKPTNLVQHAGGKRFDTGSLEYLTLLNWIRDGAPRSDQDAKLATLKVDPPQVVSRVRAKTPLKVTAT